MENARIKENIGGSRHRYYHGSSGERGFLSTDLTNSGEAVSIWNHIKNWIKDVFLPQGFPDSVSADYLEYQFWDTFQARCGNLADVRAKNGSQAKLVRLVALGLSAGLISFVSHSFQFKAITASILMGFHIFANYKAVRVVRIETLNRPRLLALLEKWFSVTRILSVEEANKSEPLFVGAAYKQNYLPHGFRLKIGCSLSEALNSIGEAEASHQYQNLHNSFRHENYMLLADFQKKKMFLIYHENISPEEELEGFFVAYLCMLHYISMEKNIQIANVNTIGMEKSTPSSEIINKVKASSRALYQDFREAAIEKGWKMDPLHLNPDKCRYKFTHGDFIQENGYTETN